MKARELILKSWDEPDGFFYKIRFSGLDPNELGVILDAIKELAYENHSTEPLDREIVRVTWFIHPYLFNFYLKHRGTPEEVVWEKAVIDAQEAIAELLGYP